MFYARSATCELMIIIAIHLWKVQRTCIIYGMFERFKRLNITMQPHAIHDQSFREQSHREPKRKLLKEARAHFLNMKKFVGFKILKISTPKLSSGDPHRSSFWRPFFPCA